MKIFCTTALLALAVGAATTAGAQVLGAVATLPELDTTSPSLPLQNSQVVSFDQPANLQLVSPSSSIVPYVGPHVHPLDQNIWVYLNSVFAQNPALEAGWDDGLRSFDSDYNQFYGAQIPEPATSAVCLAALVFGGTAFVRWRGGRKKATCSRAGNR